MGAGTGVGSVTVRKAPYSPRDSPRNGGGVVLRGSARNSPHTSPKDSSRSSNVGVAMRGVARSPSHGSPRTSVHGDARSSLTSSPQGVDHTHSGSSSSDDRSPASTRKSSLVNLNESIPSSKSTSYSLCKENGSIVISGCRGPELNNCPPVLGSIPLERTLSPYLETSPTLGGVHPSISLSQSSLEAPPADSPPPLLNEPHSPTLSGSQSPPHTLDFEDGRVLSQLPYEYSSFLDVPPSALGIKKKMAGDKQWNLL